MRPYEVMIIVDAGLEDDQIQAVLGRATEIVRNAGGTPGRLDRWGKRRFAYEISHKWEGYYAVLEATAPAAAMAELDRVLHLADEVIRHKVIRLPEGIAGRQRLRPSEEPEAAAS